MENEQIERISLDLIDDPMLAMRSQMDEEKLYELATSIAEHGLIQPVTLRKNGDRYEVVAGHRRVRASRIAQMAFINAIVKPLTDTETDTIRVHENLYREDVNPVDEARHIRKMVDVHKVAPEQLARMTGKSEAYLQARYALLDYPDYLVQAVELGHVSLTAAQWLFRIENDTIRKEYTRFAMLGGITAKRAEAWFRSWQLGSLPREATAFIEPLPEVSAEPRKLLMPCVLCRHDDDIENQIMVYAHKDCADAVKKMQENV